jgi:hypothetical protein
MTNYPWDLAKPFATRYMGSSTWVVSRLTGHVKTIVR